MFIPASDVLLFIARCSMHVQTSQGDIYIYIHTHMCIYIYYIYICIYICTVYIYMCVQCVYIYTWLTCSTINGLSLASMFRLLVGCIPLLPIACGSSGSKPNIQKSKGAPPCTSGNILPSGKHTKNYGKSPCLMGKLTISMAIFNSYVSLPDGRYFFKTTIAFKLP